MTPIDHWRNFTPIFGAVAFCTTNIRNFRTPLTSTSSTILSTYSSQRRSLRWTSSKRKIREVIEVDQIEDTYNERLSWAMPHSGLKPKNENDLWRKITFDERRHLAEDDLWQKTTYGGRQPDDLWWKTIFNRVYSILPEKNVYDSSPWQPQHNWP